MAKKNKSAAPLVPVTLENAAPAAPAEKPAEQPKPSSAMMALFAPRETLDTSKLERLNTPRMYKPEEVPVGGVVSGIIVKICDSPVSTVKGKLLWLKHASGEEFCFPCTGVIRNALAPGKGDNEKELLGKLNSYVGKTFYARRTPDKENGRYKKTMFMFDVFVS